MTNEEAIYELKLNCPFMAGKDKEKFAEAIKMGIEALENQKTGHWIISESNSTPEEYFNWNKAYLYKCSNCGREYEAEEGMGENYCSNCGAKMEGEKE